jgi:hypothetical protein
MILPINLSEMGFAQQPVNSKSIHQFPLNILFYMIIEQIRFKKLGV